MRTYSNPVCVSNVIYSRTKGNVTEKRERSTFPSLSRFLPAKAQYLTKSGGLCRDILVERVHHEHATKMEANVQKYDKEISSGLDQLLFYSSAKAGFGFMGTKRAKFR